jgi:hypothetical protein
MRKEPNRLTITGAPSVALRAWVFATLRRDKGEAPQSSTVVVAVVVHRCGCGAFEMRPILHAATSYEKRTPVAPTHGSALLEQNRFSANDLSGRGASRQGVMFANSLCLTVFRSVYDYGDDYA